jgi:hypothetical protein
MRWIGYIGVMAFAGFCAAQEPTVTLRVERRTVQVNVPFTISIEATGTNVEDPVIPDVDGLRIGKVPTSEASRTSISMVNMRSSIVRIRKMGYDAVATRTGEVRIPPITVRVDGKVLQTQPAVLNVVAERGPRPARPQPPAQTLPRPRRPSAEKDSELTWDDLAFFTSTADKTEAYQGEPILLRLSLWCILADGVAVGSRTQPPIKYPDSQGFYAATLDPQVSQQERKGWSYEVTELQQCLFPTTTGQLTIGPAHWEGMARALTRFGAQQHSYSLDTDPIVVNVRPLPTPPEGFSGSVGDFTFEAALNRNETIQGSPVTLQMKLKGRGNPSATGEPQLPHIDGVYLSDPQKDTQQLGDGISVEKTVTYLITPLEPGDMTIPEITFSYFDPRAGSYKTLAQGPFTVHVLASAEPDRRVLVGENVPVPEGSVSVVGEDIHPIVTDAGLLRPRRTPVPATVAFFSGPVIAYASLALWMRRKRRFERDVGFARGYRAKSRAHARLRAVERAEQPSEALYHALSGFIADKFNVSEAGMTSADAEKLLATRGIDAQVAATVSKTLRACDRARYADARLSDDEVRALIHAASAAMNDIEDALKRRRKSAHAQGENS